MSAVALASAGLAGTPATAEEDEGAAELRSMLEAFGGGDMPDEAITQILSQYEAMGIDPSTLFGGMDPEMLAAMVGMGGEDIDQSAFIKMLMSGAEDDAFLKLDDEAFLKLDNLDASLDDVFMGLGIDPASVQAEVAQQVLAEDDPIKLQAIQQILDS